MEFDALGIDLANSVFRPHGEETKRAVALDLHSQIALLTLLRRLAQERGMLVLAALHDLGHALRFTDRAMVLQGGALVACGPTGRSSPRTSCARSGPSTHASNPVP